jgi:Phage tail sheath C-terminal domain
MALTSPGVEVTIIDQSQYLPAATSSVPLVIIATAQNKSNPSGTGVASGTTLANAGKLYLASSQKDLVDTYGTPFFYTTTNGTPIQGYELNEYGLLAAYSALGASNRCYVLRADIDLASLVGTTSRPSGAPANGTYWLDTTSSTWGTYEFNASTGQFELYNPIVISDSAQLSGEVPKNSIGNIGDYAVNAIPIPASRPNSYGQYFYKTTNNVWVVLGSSDWCNDWPAVQAVNSVTNLTAGNTITFNLNNLFTFTVAVPAGPNNTPAGLATAINALGYTYIRAAVSSNKLVIYSSQPAQSTARPYLQIISGTGTVLGDLGLTTGYYYQPVIAYGTAAQMPLWSASQSQPAPTGSVWIKVGSSGNGLVPVVSEYSSLTQSWKTLATPLATADWTVDVTLDATGGQAIPAGSVYAQYNFNTTSSSPGFNQGPVYLWERLASGPTVITGTTANWTLTGIVGSPTTMGIRVSIPGSSTLSGFYNMNIANGMTPTTFATSWAATGVPYTTCSVTTDGAIQITHTAGGEILLYDQLLSGPNQGLPSGVLAQIGIVANTTTGVKYGVSRTQNFTAPQTSTSGTGVSGSIFVSPQYGQYVLINTGVVATGTGYAVGDTITVAGTSLGGTTPANDLVVVVSSVTAGAINAVTYVSGTPNPQQYTTQLSNWVPLTYTANEGAPVALPVDMQNWFYSVVDQVDIMVNYNNAWHGYRTLNYDSSGFPSATGSNTTDPNGPIISPSEPTTQSDGTPLVYGDIWIDTSDVELYPLINRWQLVNGTKVWVRLDNSASNSSTGVLFADARWGTSGNINPVDDPIPTITSMLTSNYVDLDAPSTSLYPNGVLLFNTRRSGYVVKQFMTNYFTSASYPNAGAYNPAAPTNINNLPEFSYTWVTVSGNQTNGAPWMGRYAQRNMVVKSLSSVVDTNTDIRDEDNFFNLIACPYYEELQPNMVVLNADRGDTAYILGDTPMGLKANATAIQAWATNAAGAPRTDEEGCVTRDTYLGLFYPSGLTTDLQGNLVAVPPSHMMLRTFLRNDNISYPWLAAAGTRRGIIDNATNIGYLDRTTGDFITTKTNIGIRDTLYVNFINPLVFFTGVGLLNFGNKTSYNSSSALDRTNVARLIAYVRRQLTLAARPFIFEPNDALTRNQIAGVVQTLMVDLVAKRGIYDYLVVCDESNNTPARIDRNELWIDVALEPVKAAEFIYIPVRVLNTGEIASL